MKDIKIRITFTTPVLGSAPSDPDIYSQYIASNAPDAPNKQEEIEALGTEEVERKGKTVFLRDEDGNPLLWDYQIRGFFKHACGILKLLGEKNASASIKAHKKYIDGMVFVYGPDKDGNLNADAALRKIPISYDGEMDNLQRSLRAETAQGPRISLANSEMIHEGATAEFVIRLLNDKLEKAVYEWLDFGKYNGLGQWRNGSYGRFTYEIIED